MKSIRPLVLLFLLLWPCISYSLDCCGIEVDPYGFVSTDLFFDTRQVLAARDNFAILWPKRILCDRFGNDINAHGGWNLTAIHTRFGLKGSWPGVWHDSTLRGVIEGDFLGVAEASTGTFRLRHAFLAVETKKWEFLAGQYWHPLFVLDCFPDTISFNNGVPMEPLSRTPQLRFTYKHKEGELILAAATQRDFASLGPIGFTPEYIRNSVIPNLHMQVRFFPKEHVTVGAAFDYKRLVPRLVTDKCIAVHETIDSVLFQIYGGYNDKTYQICAKAVYGQNGADQTLISGFAVRTRDPITNKQTYANTATATCWFDAAYWFDDQKKSIGFLTGYAKNLGAQHDLFIDPKTKQPIVFAIDPDIDNVIRFAPRFRYKPKGFQLGLELEFTRISYGKLDKRARVINPRPTSNVRLLGEILYFF